MGKSIEQLNRELKSEFAGLDITGTNVEGYYNKRFQEFLFYNSELSLSQKIESIFIRMSRPASEVSERNLDKLYPEKTDPGDEKLYLQPNEKSEITIQRVLSERTFIQDQIIRHVGNLKEPIRPDNREKLNIWVDYLRQKEKNLTIEQTVPQWTQELVALDCIYSKITIQESTREAIAKQYKKLDGQPVSGSQNLVKLYYEFKTKIDRYKKKIDESDILDAKKVLQKIMKLKLLIEDRRDSGLDEQVKSDIEKIEKNLGLN